MTLDVRIIYNGTICQGHSCEWCQPRCCPLQFVQSLLSPRAMAWSSSDPLDPTEHTPGKTPALYVEQHCSLPSFWLYHLLLRKSNCAAHAITAPFWATPCKENGLALHFLDHAGRPVVARERIPHTINFRRLCYSTDLDLITISCTAYQVTT